MVDCRFYWEKKEPNTPTTTTISFIICGQNKLFHAHRFCGLICG